MITQKKAMEAIAGVRKIQDLKHGTHKHTVPEWLLILEKQLNRAKAEWNAGTARADDNALERIAHVGACAVACLEHNVNSR